MSAHSLRYRPQISSVFLRFLLFFGHNLLPKAHFGGFQGGYGVWGLGGWAKVSGSHEPMHRGFFLTCCFCTTTLFFPIFFAFFLYQQSRNLV